LTVEPVDVDTEHCEAFAEAGTACRRLTHAVLEQKPVGQVGDRVVHRLVLNPVDEVRVAERRRSDRREPVEQLLLAGSKGSR
jgi:hypothetical protein